MRSTDYRLNTREAGGYFGSLSLPGPGKAQTILITQFISDCGDQHMARMIPSGCPPETVSVAERRFFSALQEQLSDEFTVIHSVPWLNVTARHLQQGECDFLILHPSFGMLSIETKPGDVHYDGLSGMWHRSDGSSLGKDPYLQAQRSAAALHSLLCQRVRGWSDAHMAHGHAVVFSEADRIHGRLPTHALPLITLLHGDTKCIQDKITNILAHFGEPQAKAKKELIDAAVNALREEFQLIPTFAGQLERQDDCLRRLTKQQIDILNLMRDTKRLLIRGCAGSGKTLLALEKAARLSREGKRVLLLCFNIPLAEWLRVAAEREKLAIDVFHFHGLCRHLAESAGLEYQEPAETELRSDFYNVVSPRLFEQAVSCGAGPRYDAIIVDEGQDFVADWWLPIEELLTDSRDGIMYVFYDPEQNIFAREFGFLVNEAKLTLDKNCRNTNQIAGYVRRLSVSAMEPADFTEEGFAPQEHFVCSREEELASVEKIVSELVHKRGFTPERIVIVGRRRLHNSAYATCAHLAGVRLIDETADELDPDGIRYATIYRFKGLEADCVILTGFSRPVQGKLNTELYCAASRAKFLLHVFFQRTPASVPGDGSDVLAEAIRVSSTPEPA